MKTVFEFLKKVGIHILNFIIMQLPFIIALIIGIIAGLIWGTNVGIFTFFGVGVGFVLFLMGRQLYWWITKTGDYEENDKEG